MFKTRLLALTLLILLTLLTTSCVRPAAAPMTKSPTTTSMPSTPAPTPTPKPSVPLAPARFILGDLTITPAAVMEGEEVTYSIQVSNTGGTEGSYTVVFKYKSSGGSIGSDNVAVTLMPGETKMATLTTTQNESGTYFVNVNDKGSQYTVIPRLATKPFARQTKIEVVTNNAEVTNPKGGNQTRIVRTQDGVFTLYMFGVIIQGSKELSPVWPEWRLAKRQSDGTWEVIAQGDAGTYSANLLASPDGTLHVIGRSNNTGMIWSGKPKNGTLVMTSTEIPNSKGDYPYPAAGIDASGNLCINSSHGGSTLGDGKFRWAFYIPSQSRWVTQTNELDYRYTYSYVFPGPDGQLSLVATRDVLWSALGYAQPPGTFDFVFNAIRYWRTGNISSETIQVLSFAEEIPTDQYPNSWLKLHEAYLDTKERMHIIYSRAGATTGGREQVRHRIVSTSGTTLFDEELPNGAGKYCRIFQDSQERFYLLDSLGLLYPMDQEGQSLGDPMKLDLEGHEVIHAGYGLSVPRTGTPLSDIMDVGFPSDGGKSWFYFQLDFSGK